MKESGSSGHAGTLTPDTRAGLRVAVGELRVEAFEVGDGSSPRLEHPESERVSPITATSSCRRFILRITNVSLNRGRNVKWPLHVLATTKGGGSYRQLTIGVPIGCTLLIYLHPVCTDSGEPFTTEFS